MNCWKSINLSKQYGLPRIMILSLLTMLLSFTILYTILSMGITPTKLYDDRYVWLFLGILIIYPLHKLLHYLPLVRHLDKVKWSMGQYKFFPISIRVIDPIQKNLFILALISPFIIITSCLSAGALIFEHYAHYFTILLSLHIGLCVTDFISIKNILGSPNQCFIEENEDGYEILVSKDY
jgi:Putative zincin peptidase